MKSLYHKFFLLFLCLVGTVRTFAQEDEGTVLDEVYIYPDDSDDSDYFPGGPSDEDNNWWNYEGIDRGNDGEDYKDGGGNLEFTITIVDINIPGTQDVEVKFNPYRVVPKPINDFISKIPEVDLAKIIEEYKNLHPPALELTYQTVM